MALNYESDSLPSISDQGKFQSSIFFVEHFVVMSMFFFILFYFFINPVKKDRDDTLNR